MAASLRRFWVWLELRATVILAANVALAFFAVGFLGHLCYRLLLFGWQVAG